MKKVVGLLGGIAVVIAVTAPRMARADEPDDDFAIRLLHRVERMHGGAGNSPLEEKLHRKLEQMSASQAGGTSGGFEAPPDEANKPATTDDDSQFAALQDLMQKMGPLDRVKAGIWFLVIRPNTKHHDEVQRQIDQNSTALKANEQADFREYMEIRRSLAGSSYSNRADRWQQYSKSKPQSTFAELANREVQYVKSIQKDNSTKKKAGAFALLVKIGIVVLVLALVGVIAFGAAK